MFKYNTYNFKGFVFLFLLLAYLPSFNAQSIKQFISEANAAYTKADYKSAVLLYEQGITPKSKVEEIEKCAFSHYKIENYKRAFERYQTVLSMRKVSEASTYLYAAYSAHKSGNLDAALNYYTNYQSLQKNKISDSLSYIIKAVKVYTDSFALIQNGSVSEPMSNCVNIDATASIDSQNKELIFEWDFGDGNIKQGIIVEHCYTKPGNYTIQLSTVDKKNFLKRDKDTSLSVTIAPTILTIDGKTRVKYFLAASYTAVLTVPNDWTPIDYFWDFEEDGKASGLKVMHKFKNVKTYKVSLSIAFKNSTGQVFLKSGYTNVEVFSEFDKSETLLEIEKQGGKGK
jgi:PKD repeat protein